jgi:hypothetical protein
MRKNHQGASKENSLLLRGGCLFLKKLLTNDLRNAFSVCVVDV